MNLTLQELLAYTREEQDRWQRWFAAQGDQPLAFPLAGDRMPTLGSMIQHALGAALWWAEHIGGEAATEWWTQPSDRAAPLFEMGRTAKQKIARVIEGTSDWERVLEVKGEELRVRTSVRKAVANTLIHEIRHWAQVAFIVRQHGIAPPGEHDLILSHALD